MGLFSGDKAFGQRESSGKAQRGRGKPFVGRAVYRLEASGAAGACGGVSETKGICVSSFHDRRWGDGGRNQRFDSGEKAGSGGDALWLSEACTGAGENGTGGDISFYQ